MIIALELQNEKYRNELYELGETVNKILDKTKLPNSNKAAPPNLDQQLELVKKELHNVNQFIEIYQRELNTMHGRKKQDQVESIAASEELLKNKQAELAHLKKEVRELAHKNKALEYRLAEFGKKNRAKSFDQQAMQLKELINENKNLKVKLEDLEQMQEKREVWLKNNIESVKTLEQKVRAPKCRSKRRSPDCRGYKVGNRKDWGSRCPNCRAIRRSSVSGWSPVARRATPNWKRNSLISRRSTKWCRRNSPTLRTKSQKSSSRSRR